jgi:hypothetical protein
MTEPTFDIFAGGPEKDPVWVEAVQGLSDALERMEQIAQKTPGQYFVFSIGSHAILARTETFKKPELSKIKTA